jgi:PKHD-type hydroxylase
MNFKNGYWFFDKVLSSKFCDDIIKHGNTQKEEIALTGNLKPENLNESTLKDLKKKRDSNVVWLDDQWIYNEIFPFVKTANQNAGWNFEWDWAESCQFTKYKLNQYYDWHQDSWEEPYPENRGINFAGKIRKLSVTVNLTEGTEYEGGDLQFDFSDPENKENIKTVGQARSKGSVIVFPSYHWHRVSPVTKGTRYSLVIWCCGKPFI